MKKRTFKSNVFRRAYTLQSLTGKTFPVSLSHAWAIERLIRQMQKGVVHFAYERTDGSLRKARGTLTNIEQLIKGTGKQQYKSVSYYDIDVQGFRSFRIDKFITVYPQIHLSHF